MYAAYPVICTPLKSALLILFSLEMYLAVGVGLNN